jgi:Fe-S-cluster containining protein
MGKEGFNCTGCGACCMLVGRAVRAVRRMKDSGIELSNTDLEILNFPHKIKENGHCEHLKEDNTCAVYETRPDICRVDVTWYNHHRQRMTKEEYFKKSEQACLDLQEIIL